MERAGSCTKAGLKLKFLYVCDSSWKTVRISNLLVWRPIPTTIMGSMKTLEKVVACNCFVVVCQTECVWPHWPNSVASRPGMTFHVKSFDFNLKVHFSLGCLARCSRNDATKFPGETQILVNLFMRAFYNYVLRHSHRLQGSTIDSKHNDTTKRHACFTFLLQSNTWCWFSRSPAFSRYISDSANVQNLMHVVWNSALEITCNSGARSEFSS